MGADVHRLGRQQGTYACGMNTILDPGQPGYLLHFGLSHPPFDLRPTTDGFFDGAERGALLTDLATSITLRDPVISLIGEYGSGKSTLARMLVQRESARTRFICPAQSALDRSALMQALARDLGLPDIEAGPIQIEAIRHGLREARMGNRAVVLLLDQAHTMPIDTLRLVCALADLDDEGERLIQLVLLGEPDLNDMATSSSQSDSFSLRDHIVQQFAIPLLDEAQSRRFLQHRIEHAGGQASIVSAPALRLMAGSAGGLMRRLNLLADRSLNAAWKGHDPQVMPAHVYSALAAVAFEFDCYPVRRSLRESAKTWTADRSRRSRSAAVH